MDKKMTNLAMDVDMIMVQKEEKEIYTRQLTGSKSKKKWKKIYEAADREQNKGTLEPQEKVKVIREEVKIKERWVEYFRELLGVEGQINRLADSDIRESTQKGSRRDGENEEIRAEEDGRQQAGEVGMGGKNHTVIERNQLRWYGHLNRMGDNRQVKSVWEARTIPKWAEKNAKKQRDEDAGERTQHLRKEVDKLLKTVPTRIVGTDRGEFQNKNRIRKSGEETETPDAPNDVDKEWNAFDEQDIKAKQKLKIPGLQLCKQLL
ncbi:hypothetical protein QE152_g34810 [Popillia japonica]|uniref:Uncharacterized protein n=1 Tax=Popillia japonica TaxID=7064 RepID=A0AAW1IT09_POPJA